MIVGFAGSVSVLLAGVVSVACVLVCSSCVVCAVYVVASNTCDCLLFDSDLTNCSVLVYGLRAEFSYAWFVAFALTGERPEGRGTSGRGLCLLVLQVSLLFLLSTPLSTLSSWFL